MAEGTLTDYIRKIVAKAEPYLPQVPKPKRKIPLQQKLLWCGACVCYLYGNGPNTSLWCYSSRI